MQCIHAQWAFWLSSLRYLKYSRYCFQNSNVLIFACPWQSPKSAFSSIRLTILIIFCRHFYLFHQNNPSVLIYVTVLDLQIYASWLYWPSLLYCLLHVRSNINLFSLIPVSPAEYLMHFITPPSFEIITLTVGSIQLLSIIYVRHTQDTLNAVRMEVRAPSGDPPWDKLEFLFCTHHKRSMFCPAWPCEYLAWFS